jgi:hypothetical protein
MIRESNIDWKVLYAASFPIIDCFEDLVSTAKNGYRQTQCITYKFKEEASNRIRMLDMKISNHLLE